MSILTGFLIEKYNGKYIILASYSISFAGALTFAINASYTYALLFLFLIGMAMAMLQVVINLLLRIAGGEKHFAFNSVLAHLIFGLASFMSPKLYIYLVHNLQNGFTINNSITRLIARIVPDCMPWISLYWVFVIVALLMILIIALVRIPKVKLNEVERIGTKNNIVLLFKNKIVILYFIGIIALRGYRAGCCRLDFQIFGRLSPI